MSKLIALLLLVTAATTTLRAAQIDIAIIQFPEAITVEQLNDALSRVKLAEMTDADKTVTRDPLLRGGYVLFAQSVPAAPQFSSSTRLANERADVLGRWTGTSLQLSIVLSEGVQAGLRRFTRKNYTANAPLTPGPARVLSLSTGTGKSASSLRGQTTVKEISFCTAIVAQVSR